MTKNKKPGSVWVALALMGVTIGAVMAALLIFLAAARSAEILSRPEAGETALLLLKGLTEEELSGFPKGRLLVKTAKKLRLM